MEIFIKYSCLKTKISVVVQKYINYLKIINIIINRIISQSFFAHTNYSNK